MKRRICSLALPENISFRLIGGELQRLAGSISHETFSRFVTLSLQGVVVKSAAAAE